MSYPVTPDGRYFLVKGRLWRTSNPSLSDENRAALSRELGIARNKVKAALTSGIGLEDARERVNELKVALGERGAVWWGDGAPDYNRRLARNTPYAPWLLSLSDAF
jgi:hypothetical protein